MRKNHLFAFGESHVFSGVQNTTIPASFVSGIASSERTWRVGKATPSCSYSSSILLVSFACNQSPEASEGGVAQSEPTEMSVAKREIVDSFHFSDCREGDDGEGEARNGAT